MARVDSPLALSPSRTTPGQLTSPSQSAKTTASTSPERAKRPRQPAMRKHSGQQASQTSSLRFFVVDHPTQLKDKKALKLNRKHVMQDYLDKERRKPNSTDARVIGHMGGRKRKRPDAYPLGSTPNPSHPRTIFAPQQSSVWHERGDTARSCSVTTHVEHSKRRDSTDNRSGRLISSQRPVVFVDDLSPLVHHNTSGRWDYLSTSLETLPDPSAPLGSNLNPFDTWPKPSNTTVDVEHLKWICTRDFGTTSLTTHWIPTLLKAKHAFLSSLCISSSHDDIMQRGIQERHQRLPFGSSQRWAVRGEVMSMINNAIKNSESRVADATIVAVLQLLNSEIMGCDGRGMAIHQRGLHNMIVERGGLHQLGVDGHLSSILTM